jgi:hypothetical protein
LRIVPTGTPSAKPTSAISSSFGTPNSGNPIQ